MDNSDMFIVYAIIWKILVVGAGVFCMFLGYRLLNSDCGYAGTDADFTVGFGDFSVSIHRATPAVVLVTAGMGIIGATIVLNSPEQIHTISAPRDGGPTTRTIETRSSEVHDTTIHEWMWKAANNTGSAYTEAIRSIIETFPTFLIDASERAYENGHENLSHLFAKEAALYAYFFPHISEREDIVLSNSMRKEIINKLADIYRKRDMPGCADALQSLIDLERPGQSILDLYDQQTEGEKCVLY